VYNEFAPCHANMAPVRQQLKNFRCILHIAAYSLFSLSLTWSDRPVNLFQTFVHEVIYLYLTRPVVLRHTR